MTTKEKTTHVALLIGPLGGGSWKCGTSAEEAAKGCARIFHGDWSHMYKLKEGRNHYSVNVWDVSEIEEWNLDERGLWNETEQKWMPVTKVVEVPVKGLMD